MNDWLLIGERLNTHRSALSKCAADRNPDPILNELTRQLHAGVTHVDLNATASKNESDDLAWLVETVLPQLPANVGLVLDTPHPECAARSLQLIGRRPGTILNGISGDMSKHAEMLRLARVYDTGVIAVLAAPLSPPRSADERMSLAESLRAKFEEAAIPEEQQIFDPQILPVAYDALQPRAALECARMLRARWPKSRVLAGVSNVSFTLPRRALLNRSFVAMLLASGVDTLLCDPCADGFAESYAAARALLGRDDFFTDYLSSLVDEK